MRIKGTEAGPGLRRAGSVGLLPGTAGEGSLQMGFVKAAGPCVGACPGAQAAQQGKSKRRKSRQSTHTHQNWTCLVCLAACVLGTQRGCDGAA